MKATIKVEKVVEIRAVLINIAPRYIGDSTEDDMPTDFPLLNSAKTEWVAKVDIDTGKIEGWPAGDARKMHVKVCDAGIYTLLDANGEQVAKLENNYVPHGVVPGDYGDYVVLDIDASGLITNWPKSPDISAFFCDGE